MDYLPESLVIGTRQHKLLSVFGTPESSSIGTYSVEMIATYGSQSVSHSFTLTVEPVISSNTETTTSTTDNSNSSGTTSSTSINSNQESQSFNIQVLLFENNSTDYRVLLNEDRLGGLNGDADPDLDFYVGDTINFEIDTPGHPFYLKTVQGTGIDDLIAGVTNNGATNGTVSWTPTTTGTYYYQCSLHNGMYGTITIN